MARFTSNEKCGNFLDDIEVQDENQFITFGAIRKADLSSFNDPYTQPLIYHKTYHYDN
jgi:hypothetical protein